MKKPIYTVRNRYGIAGESRHRSIHRALAERDRREGRGWEVWDNEGYRWDGIRLTGGQYEIVRVD